MAPPSRILLVGNPASGRGLGARRLEEARGRMQGAEVRLEIRVTTRPGEATELVRTACAVERPDLVLALGGDGTLRDVAEGLLGADVPLGILPAGTGNDLIRTLGIPPELDAALETARHGRDRLLDVWAWNGTPFLNVAGLGLDAAVAEAVNTRFRSLRGTVAYVAAFLTVFPTYPPFSLSLRWPGGEWRGMAWLAAFANAVCYGGGMRIAPAAVPDDGLLDLIVVEAVPRLELLRQFPRLFSGEHIRHPAVRQFRVAAVELECASLRATIDGELLGMSPAHVALLPEKLRVRVP